MRGFVAGVPANGGAPRGGRVGRGMCWVHGLDRAGWVRGTRRKPIHGGSMAPSMAPTVPRTHPARPLTVSCAARHGMKEEKQRQQRVARCACSCRAEPTLGLPLSPRKAAKPGLGSTTAPKNKEGRGEAASLFQIPSRQRHPRMAWIYSSVTGKLSEAGREGPAGPLAPWMAPSSPHGEVTPGSWTPDPTPRVT